MTDTATLESSSFGEFPRVAADAIVLNAQAEILLIKRRDNDMWAIPGGMMEPGEFPEASAKRELREETGLRVSHPSFYQFVAADPDRDPRSHILAIVSAFQLPDDFDTSRVVAQDDAKEVKWVPYAEAMTMPLFADHNEHLMKTYEKIQETVEESAAVARRRVSSVLFGATIILGMVGFYTLGKIF